MYLKSYIEDIIYAKSLRAKYLIIGIAILVLFIRRTDSFINPQFWAEDGNLFFLGQYESGSNSIVRPYAGYLHLIPRLIAFFSELLLPYSLIPFAYTFSCLLITIFVIASIFSIRFDVKYKGLFSLSLVLIPHYGNEVFLNVTNIQWILCILLAITATKVEPNHSFGKPITQYALDILTLIFCGLTGPFLVLLMPLFVLKWFHNKSKYNSIIVCIVGIIVAIQLSYILVEVANSETSSIRLDLNIYSQIVGRRIFGELFLGGLERVIDPYLLSALYFIIVATLSYHSEYKKKLTLSFLCIHFILILATLYKFKSIPEILTARINGVRYFYLPHIMLVWTLLIALEKLKNWKKVLISMALFCVLFSALSTKFRTRYIDYDWSSYCDRIGHEDVIIPINPKGWTIYVRTDE